MNNLNEMARIERNRDQREWNAKHKEQKAAANRKYWEKRASKLAAEKVAEQTEVSHE